MLGIARLTLAKSNTYFIINFLILPISFAISAIFSAITLLLSVLGIAIAIGVAVSFVYFTGGVKYYESQTYYYDYKTSDGRYIRHVTDNKYMDTSGNGYEMRSDGNLYEL